MESSVVERNIKVEDISVDKDSLVGNAVADDFVQRCAHRLGEMHIVQRGRVGLYTSSVHVTGSRISSTDISLQARLVYNLIEIVGRDTRLRLSRNNIQDLSCQAADFAHPILLFLVQNRDVVSADEFLF